MKIIHIVSNYYPAKGGPQYTVKCLSEIFANKYGDEVQVFTSDSMYDPSLYAFKRIEPNSEIINNVKIRRFSFNRWHFKLIDFANKVMGKLFNKPLPFRYKKLKNGMDSPKLMKAVLNEEADIIMATTASYNFVEYPLLRNKDKYPKPFVLYGALHLHIHWDTKSEFIQRTLSCDAYIANTEYERKYMIDIGMKREKVFTIGTGVNVHDYIIEKNETINFRRKYGIVDDEILIGHIGRISEGKGVLLLYNTFKLLHSRGLKVKLLLAGTYTPFVDEIVKIIEQEKVPVCLIVDFDESIKNVIFNALDIFVLASVGESFGVVFLEAWSCNKPVVGVNTGAVASVIGTEGLLFMQNSVTDLAAKLTELIENESLRLELGRNGFNKVKNHYSLQVIAEKYRNVYKHAINNYQLKY